MTREAIIEETIKTLNKLPVEKAGEVADFAAYVLKRHEKHTLEYEIEKLVEESNAFQFLKNEEDLYTIRDFKEKY